MCRAFQFGKPVCFTGHAKSFSWQLMAPTTPHVPPTPKKLYHYLNSLQSNPNAGNLAQDPPDASRFSQMLSRCFQMPPDVSFLSGGLRLSHSNCWWVRVRSLWVPMRSQWVLTSNEFWWVQARSQWVLMSYQWVLINSTEFLWGLVNSSWFKQAPESSQRVSNTRIENPKSIYHKIPKIPNPKSHIINAWEFKGNN